MAIKPNFTQADVQKRFNKFLEVVERRQIDRLKMLGEMCITRAREIPASIGFTDQTGNLRSSIGYTIFNDGVAIHESFEQVKEGAEGVATGRMIAEKIGDRYQGKGLVLVVVAGMNYAIYLEAKGRDVLTSAEQLAQQELPRMLSELVSNINKAL